MTNNDLEFFNQLSQLLSGWKQGCGPGEWSDFDESVLRQWEAWKMRHRAAEPKAMPTSKHESPLRQYFRIRPVIVEDEPEAQRIEFHVGNQTFQFGPEYCESMEHAEWFVAMGIKAMHNAFSGMCNKCDGHGYVDEGDEENGPCPETCDECGGKGKTTPDETNGCPSLRQALAEWDRWSAKGKPADVPFNEVLTHRAKAVEGLIAAVRASVGSPVEPARELSASEAASFEKAFAKSPRRVEPSHSLVAMFCGCLCSWCEKERAKEMQRQNGTEP